MQTFKSPQMQKDTVARWVLAGFFLLVILATLAHADPYDVTLQKTLFEGKDWTNNADGANAVLWTGQYFVVTGKSALGDPGKGGLYVYTEDGTLVGKRDVAVDSGKPATWDHSWDVVADVDAVSADTFVVSLGGFREGPLVRYKITSTGVIIDAKTFEGSGCTPAGCFGPGKQAQQAAVVGGKVVLAQQNSDPAAFLNVIYSLPGLQQITERPYTVSPWIGVGNLMLVNIGANTKVYRVTSTNDFVEVSTMPRALGAAVDGNHIALVFDNPKRISTFDASDSGLTLLTTTALPADAPNVYLSIGAAGQYLAAAKTVLRNGQTLTVQPLPPSLVVGDERPGGVYGVAVSPNGKVLFATGDAAFLYSVNAAPPPVVTGLPPAPALPASPVFTSSSAALNLTAPAVANGSFNVTLMHNASTSLSCFVGLGSSWLDTFSLAPLTAHKTTITVALAGDYAVVAQCIDGNGLVLQANRMVSVANGSVANVTAPGNVTIIFPTTSSHNVTSVTYTHALRNTTVCSLYLDGADLYRSAFVPMNIVRNEPLGAPVPPGVHTINLTCANSSKTVSAKVTFTITGNSTGNSSNTPALRLPGGARTVRVNTSFTLAGRHFSPNEDVDLYWSGQGFTRSDRASADEKGEFEFVATGLPRAGTYVVEAESANHSDVYASLSFDVLDTYVVAPHNTSGTTPPPPSGTTYVPVPDGAHEQVDVPVGGAEEDPQNEVPEPTYPEPTRTPDEVVPEDDTATFRWWLVPLIIFIIIAGVAGYLVYTGSLDISSGEAFVQSVKNIAHGDLLPAAKKATPLANSTMRTFIAQERKKGFDDLTIRSALLEKGWEKAQVDAVFDDIYKGPKKP